MTTPLTEPAVIELMRQEHARASAVAAELRQRVRSAEEAMQPYKDAYEAALQEWAKANRLAESLAACLAAKEPKVAEVAA